MMSRICIRKQRHYSIDGVAPVHCKILFCTRINVKTCFRMITLIIDPLDEDRLLKLLHSMIRDSIRMCTHGEYICILNTSVHAIHCFFGGGEYFEVK